MQIKRTAKWQKILFCLFSITLISTTLIIPIVGTAAIDWDGLSYDVANTITVRNGYLNVARIVGFGILKLLANIIDMFDAAIDTLLSINLYDLIKDRFNIKSVVYPVAWAIASLAVIIAAIFLIIRADKAHVTDFFRNLLCSLFILIALPTLVQSLSALKSSGVKDVKNIFTGQNINVNDDGTVSAATLGETLLANYLDVVDLSIENNEVVSFDESTNYAQNAKTVYLININETLDKATYNKKITDTTAPGSKQYKYDDLQLIDKLNLLDKAAGCSTSSTGGYTSLTSLYETWNARSADYVISYGDFNIYLENPSAIVYAKTGGGTTYNTREEVYCQFQPYVSGTYSPVRQVMIGDTIYKDQANTEEISTITWGWDWIPTSHDGSYWGYKKVKVYSYQKELLEKLNEYMLSDSRLWNSLPDSFRNQFSAQWVSENILRARTLEQAISNIEGMKINTEYGISFSIIEYLNLSDNYINYLNNEMTSGGVEHYEDLATMADYQEDDTVTKISKQLKTGFYPEEELYKFHINFGYAIITMIITVVCLLFAGLKVAALMFDVLFAQIVAPLVVASDVQGSGRAKQVVQNLISCNICFICVLFILRLYLWVLIAIQSQYSFLVCIILTLAGAKFVIDGPDLIIKILGMDAGVKSGFATLMSLRSAAGIANGVGRTVGNVAKKAANVGGKTAKTAAKAAGGTAKAAVRTTEGAAKGIAGGIYGGVKNGTTTPGKIGNAIGGSAVGAVTGAVGGLVGKTNAGATAGYAATNMSGALKYSYNSAKDGLKGVANSAKDGMRNITNADKIGSKTSPNVSNSTGSTSTVTANSADSSINVNCTGGATQINDNGTTAQAANADIKTPNMHNAVPNANNSTGTASNVNAPSDNSSVNVNRASGTAQVNDNGSAVQTANADIKPSANNMHNTAPNVSNSTGAASSVTAQSGNSSVNVNRTGGASQIKDNGSVAQTANVNAKPSTNTMHNAATNINNGTSNTSTVTAQSGNSSVNVNRAGGSTQINDNGSVAQNANVNAKPSTNTMHNAAANINNGTSNTSTITAQSGNSSVNVNRAGGASQIKDNGSVAQTANVNAKPSTNTMHNAAVNINNGTSNTSTVTAQSGNSSVNVNRAGGTTQINDNGSSAQTSNVNNNMQNTSVNTNNVAGSTSTVTAQSSDSSVNINRTGGTTQINYDADVQTANNVVFKTKKRWKKRKK